MQQGTWTHRERRALPRVACALSAVYHAGSRRRHAATLCDVGHGGLRLRSAQALIPGQFVLLRIPQNVYRGPLEFKARVAWSQYRHEVRAFESGARVLYDVSDVGVRLAELVYDALEQNGSTAGLYEESAGLPLAWIA